MSRKPFIIHCIRFTLKPNFIDVVQPDLSGNPFFERLRTKKDWERKAEIAAQKKLVSIQT